MALGIPIDATTRSAQQTPREELLNALTHGFSAILAVIGLVVLIAQARIAGDAARMVTFSIYGATLVAMYLASTCYHLCRSPQRKHTLRILDHSAIYLLIAGTYTPFLIVMVRGAWGWGLLGVLWGLTVVGVILKLFFIHRFELLSTIVYVAMGWIGLTCAGPMFRALPGPCLAWLFAGGAAYTLGVPVYLWRALPFNHALWHLFVLAGSTCHFLAVFLYVLPT